MNIPDEQVRAAQFRKKPVAIEAMQFDGTVASANAIMNWAIMPDGMSAEAGRTSNGEACQWLAIRTLEGTMTAERGDWIIRGVKGEFYPCKPDIFAATYESAALTAFLSSVGGDPVAWFSHSGFGGAPFVSEHRSSVESWIKGRNEELDRRGCSEGYKQRGPFPLYTASALAARVAVGGDGLDYTPGRIDKESPKRIWLQINVDGDNDERDDSWPGADGVTWQDESVGGLEVQYVRADLATATARAGVDLNALRAGLHEIADFDTANDCTTGKGHSDAIYKARDLLALIDQQGGGRG